MDTKSGFRLTPQMVMGLIIIAIGVLFTLDNLEMINAHDYLRYWPVLLIAYGAARALQPDPHRGGRFWGIVIMFFGTALLVDRLHILLFRLWDFWPLLLVALGAMMIFRTGCSRRRSVAIQGGEDARNESSIVNASAFLGGSKRNVHTKNFTGGELTAVMGGCEIDLRNAAIETNPAIIDVFAMWGGISIKVPQNWSVSFEGTPILGGYDDKTFRQTETNQRLIIRGTVVMGGIEVTN